MTKTVLDKDRDGITTVLEKTGQNPDVKLCSSIPCGCLPSVAAATEAASVSLSAEAHRSSAAKTASIHPGASEADNDVLVAGPVRS